MQYKVYELGVHAIQNYFVLPTCSIIIVFIVKLYGTLCYYA